MNHRMAGGLAACALLLAGCGSSSNPAAPAAPPVPSDAVSVQNGTFTITDNGKPGVGSEAIRQGVYTCSRPSDKTNWMVTDLTATPRDFGKNGTAKVSRSKGTILILSDCDGPWYKQGEGVNTGRSVGTIAATGALQLPLSKTTGTDPCKGTGGYADIRPGAQVVFYDNAGAILATGQLDNGTLTGDQCTLPWTVVGIPAGKGPYQYEVSHRGKLVVTEEQISSQSLAATLGGT